MGGIAQPPPFTPSPKFLFATHRQSRSAGWVGDAPAAERLQGRQGVGEGGGGRCSLGNLRVLRAPPGAAAAPQRPGTVHRGRGCAVCVCVCGGGETRSCPCRTGGGSGGEVQCTGPVQPPPPFTSPLAGEGAAVGACRGAVGRERSSVLLEITIAML